jgi:hypothetical protein
LGAVADILRLGGIDLAWLQDAVVVEIDARFELHATIGAVHSRWLVRSQDERIVASSGIPHPSHRAHSPGVTFRTLWTLDASRPSRAGAGREERKDD